MFKHKIASSLAVLCSSLVLTGVASASDMGDGSYTFLRSSPHPYVYASPDTFVSCYKVYEKLASGKVIKHHYCKVYGAGFACTEYAFFANPIHTDRMCTKWQWVHNDRYYGKWEKVR